MISKKKLQYLLLTQRLHQLYVVKRDISFNHLFKHTNKADKSIDFYKDKLLNNIIDGNKIGDSKKIAENIIDTALQGQANTLMKKRSKIIQGSVDQTVGDYSKILSSRFDSDAYKLKAKIEAESKLSDSEIKKKYGELYRKNAKNIVRDALHTNQSRMSFLHALDKGYKYKVWMNGRARQHRIWHRANFIESVPIDDYFIITGSYRTEMMYPGDLAGGAENVANCRCWLSYTNNRPSDLRRKGSSSRGYSKSTQNNNTKSSNKKNIGSRIKSTFDSVIERIQNKVKQTNNYSNKKGMGSRIKESVSLSIRRIKDKTKSSNSNVNKKNSIIPRINKKSIYGEFEEATNSKRNKWGGKYKNNITFNEKGKVIKKEYDYFSVYWEQLFLSNKQMDIIVNLMDNMCKQYISKITLKKAKKNKNGKYINGSVMPGSNEIILREVPGRHFAEYINTIYHEVGHIIDHKIFNKQWGLSSSDEWKKAFILDKEHNIKNEDVIKNEYFVSDYARDKYDEYREKGNLKRLYAEDLADSFKYYIDSPISFRNQFPHRYEILEKYLRSK